MAKKTPLRKCVGCGEMIEKKDMLRIIKTKDGEILFDPTGKANGRGAYLHNQRQCFEQAVRSKGLERSFRISIPQEVYDRISEEMIHYDSK